MALGKIPVTMVSNQTIIAGGNYISPTSLDLSGAISLEVSFKGAFNSSTNGGAKVEMFSDPSSADQEFVVGAHDEPIDAMDIASAAGYTKSKPAQFKCSSKYVKFKVINLGNQSLTGVYVYALPQTQ